uniref:ribonuclease HII n=2 Tax=Rhodohalobacter sp. 8-1 TaxID=3131972 RepID=UPI0030EBFEBA
MELDRYTFEKQLWSEGYTRAMGLDEVGRGCLCGPVVAAGVILDPDTSENLGLKDSKTIKKADREDLSAQIKSEALYWTIKSCSPTEIDKMNILQASLKAMQKCTESRGATPDYLLIDGNKSPATMLPLTCLVKGDNRSASIAAASILAKVYRDDLMVKLHEKYPYYGWNSNVGYPTQEHFAGLETYGYTMHHRKSFKLRTEKSF